MTAPPGLLTLLSGRAGAFEEGRLLAARLAGSADPLFLPDHGVRNLARPQTPAEIHALRRLLAPVDGVVGLVVAGRIIPRKSALGPGRTEAGEWSADEPIEEESALLGHALAVTDHIALAVPSPLLGPNDPAVGPRFPVTAGLYRPDLASALVDEGETAGAVLPSGVVVCVRETGALRPLEHMLLDAGRATAVSAELAPVALVAAHLGRRVAAVLVDEAEGERR